MASKWLSTPERGGLGPGWDEPAAPLDPWQRTEYRQFFDARDENNRYEIQLSARSTAEVWRCYKEFKATGTLHIMMLSFDGEIHQLLNGRAHEVVRVAMQEMWAIYNLKSRRCWRPAWMPHVELLDRSAGNVMYEPVKLLGWTGLIPGWEFRPTAKLFRNM